MNFGLCWVGSKRCFCEILERVFYYTYILLREEGILSLIMGKLVIPSKRRCD